MASEGDMEPAQTQSQSNDIDTNGLILHENETEVWGRLIAKNTALVNYDLTSSVFTAGRMASLSCCFTQSLGSRMYLQLSKMHFKITKDLSDPLSPVYLEDFSRNGTYLNQRKIGKGKKRILNHNDAIAVAHPSYRLFRYLNSLRSSTELPSEITKKYHVGRKLGSGACGTVYLVHDYMTCLPFALKHIKKHQMNGYKKDKAKNEGDIMKTIKHPCVVKMHGIDDIGDAIYITLEVMEGGDLLNRIQQSSHLDENISKLFFYQMCHAIKYLHERKITHRDLKPDNILLASSEPETLVKISDFGLSKLCQNNSVLRTMCGTPHYVAPEVLLTQGRGQYTEKVDVWSLGVVLFACLSGTLPFSNDYGTLAADQIQKGDFTFRSNVWNKVTPLAKKLVREMLTVNVDERPSIDQLLKHEWLNDYGMKCKAHKIMKIAAPPPFADSSNTTNGRVDNFAVPYNVEEIRPANDENAQPMKKRRMN